VLFQHRPPVHLALAAAFASPCRPSIRRTGTGYRLPYQFRQHSDLFSATLVYELPAFTLTCITG
jgi:hypothetical protein